MVVKRGEGDFTQVYRPCKISEVVGNEEAKNIIKTAFEENKIPHNFLFHGLSGTGSAVAFFLLLNEKGGQFQLQSQWRIILRSIWATQSLTNSMNG